MKSLFLLIIAFTAFTSAISAQPKTVTDYFLSMPEEFYATDIEGNKFKTKTALTKFRKSLIKIEDIKNGYLRIEGTWEGWAEIALFKKKDGSYLIAQAETGCGPACDGFIKFFTFQNGKWTDVTTKVFPSLSETQISKIFVSKKIDTKENGTTFYYLLPRQGTTVTMACNMCSDEADDFVLQEFSWNGEKFSRKN